VNARRPRVLVVQERLPHYRVPFFEQLRPRLASVGVDLSVAHGRGHGAIARRGDEVELPWAHVLENRVIGLGRRSIVWQPVLRLAAEADLLIVEQASRMAVNYPLLARQSLGGTPVAFWGHGANLQTDGSLVSRLSEAAKSRYSQLPKWWFAYTEGSARRVEAVGFARERITVVQNAVDTSLIEATEAERDPHRCIYVGSLFHAKRLDLVFAAADIVAADVPEFRLAVVGDGLERGYVEQAASSRPYVDYLGAKFGKELAVELKRSSLMLMPGHVGLGVLDAFAAGLPVVTAHGMAHSPEFEYLEDGVNALITEPTGAALAAALRRGLEPSVRGPLSVTAAALSRRYTLDQMTHNFVAGVQAACEDLRVSAP
jgi:L-malate glycosyltransferase